MKPSSGPVAAQGGGDRLIPSASHPQHLHVKNRIVNPSPTIAAWRVLSAWVTSWTRMFRDRSPASTVWLAGWSALSTAIAVAVVLSVGGTVERLRQVVRAIHVEGDTPVLPKGHEVAVVPGPAGREQSRDRRTGTRVGIRFPGVLVDPLRQADVNRAVILDHGVTGRRVFGGHRCLLVGGRSFSSRPWHGPVRQRIWEASCPRHGGPGLQSSSGPAGSPSRRWPRVSRRGASKTGQVSEECL